MIYLIISLSLLLITLVLLIIQLINKYKTTEGELGPPGRDGFPGDNGIPGDRGPPGEYRPIISVPNNITKPLQPIDCFNRNAVIYQTIQVNDVTSSSGCPEYGILVTYCTSLSTDGSLPSFRESIRNLINLPSQRLYAGPCLGKRVALTNTLNWSNWS